jgi:hypothetical protein
MYARHSEDKMKPQQIEIGPILGSKASLDAPCTVAGYAAVCVKSSGVAAKKQEFIKIQN